jgi:hypothetical protein
LAPPASWRIRVEPFCSPSLSTFSIIGCQSPIAANEPIACQSASAFIATGVDIVTFGIASLP